MKKYLALILVLALSLSLCACTITTEYGDIVKCLDDHDYYGAIMLIEQMANEHYGANNDDGGDNGEDEPQTDMEKHNQYDNLIRNLDSFTQPDAYVSIWVEETETSLQGNDAWAYLYDQFVAMGDFEDCAQIVENFTILEDVYTGHSSTVTDNMDNVSEGYNVTNYYYNADGTISKVTGPNYTQLSRMYDSSGTVNLEYADDGSVSKIKLTSGDDVNAIITPSYDADGKLISEVIKTNDGEVTTTLTYDAQNNLISRVRTEDNYFYRLDYTYNEKNQLVKETYTTGSESYSNCNWTAEYTYDANGNPAGKTVTDTSWGTAVNQYTYTCDDQGRVITETITYGKIVHEDGDEDLPNYASEVITHKYTDYYIYNAE